MGYHAELNPSGAYQWTECTAAPGAQRGKRNDSNDASRNGTCCHQISAEVLEHDFDPQTYLGRVLVFWDHPESESSGEDWLDVLEQGHDPLMVFQHQVKVTQEMIDHCCTAINYVRKRVELTGAFMQVEQRVPIGHFTGEGDCWMLDGEVVPEDTPGAVYVEPAGGTSDVCLMYGDTIEVIDFKFGRHKVTAYDVIQIAHKDFITGEDVPEKVRANLQMACYALGSIEKFGLFYEFKRVTMTIIQPYVSHASDYSCSVEELFRVQEFLRVKAEETRTNPVFKPSPDNCHFCRANTSCEARTRAVIEMALDGFDDVDTATVKPVKRNTLGSLYAALPMVIEWAKAVAADVMAALKQGEPVVRNDGVAYKLVDGKKGDREWRDPAAAEELLKSMRLKQEQMYTRKLLGPAGIEKLAKVPRVKRGETPIPPVLGTTQWNRVQAQIHQKDGGPTIVLETDPRPPSAAPLDGFGDVPVGVAADCLDLF